MPPTSPSSSNAAGENTVAEWFLLAIKKGKLKATDAYSGKPIPASKIFTWDMPADTVAVYDNNREVTSYKVVVHEIDPEKISQIRIQQDWYLDRTGGKVFSRIKWIELLMEVQSPGGEWLGYKPFCRIYY